MSADLFADAIEPRAPYSFAPGAWHLPGFVADCERELLDVIAHLLSVSPWRQMQTPGGFTMSVSMSNCGDWGWVSDRRGYRYQGLDPLTGQAWPAMPGLLRDRAVAAAAAAGYSCFDPDACLINRYQPGARMSLHQDKNELDFTQPIVSFSLGLPALFLFGGEQRQDKPLRLPLQHADVLVWGGPSRLHFHGVQPVKPGMHPLLGEQRINLTFRRAR